MPQSVLVPPIGVEDILYYYTSAQEVERIWSAAAAALFLSDTTAGRPEILGSTPNIWADLVYEATDEVNFYIAYFYDPASAYLNRWVRRSATWIASHLLSFRRNNPGCFQEMYDRVKDNLEKVQKGLFQIPRLGWTADLMPAMSNYAIDDYYNINKCRVQQSTSVGGVYANQFLDPVNPNDWY